jgi:prepilin-type N-terminal cleavage/methylation domain-containing protein
MQARRVALPTCATASRCQHGFSLLEMLVALIVVVLVTSLVNLGVSSGGEDIRLKALVHELAEVGSYALDEAQTTGVDYGLLLDEEQQDGDTVYTFNWLEHRPEGWRDPQSGKEVFAKQRLPAGISLDLELDDSPLTDESPSTKSSHHDKSHSKSAKDAAEADTVHPQIVFYSSGETTPGALNVRRVKGGELLWRIEWNLLGQFKVLPHGVDEDSDNNNQVKHR